MSIKRACRKAVLLSLAVVLNGQSLMAFPQPRPFLSSQNRWTTQAFALRLTSFRWQLPNWPSVWVAQAATDVGGIHSGLHLSKTEPSRDILIPNPTENKRTPYSTLRTFFERNENGTWPGILLKQGPKAPDMINQMELFHGLDMLVLQSPHDPAAGYIGIFLEALERQGNRIDIRPLNDNLKGPGVKADIVIGPQGDDRVLAWVAQAGSNGHGVGQFRYLRQRAPDEESTHEVNTQQINLVVPFTEKQMGIVQDALGKHVSQNARTQYQPLVVAYGRATAAWGRWRDFLKDEPYANSFTVTSLNDITENGEIRAGIGTDRYQAVFSDKEAAIVPKGFIPLRLDQGRSVFVAPHQDDREIAGGGLVRRLMEASGSIVNINHGSGHAGLSDTENYKHLAADILLGETWKSPKSVARDRLMNGEFKSPKQRLEWEIALRQVKTSNLSGAPTKNSFPLRVTEDFAAAKTLRKGTRGRTLMRHLSLDLLYSEKEMEAAAYNTYSRAYTDHVAIVDESLVKGSAVPWIVFLPHPLDAHPSHTRTTQLAYKVLKRIQRENPQAKIVLAHYMAPWAGGTNTYFHAQQTTDPRTDFAQFIYYKMRGLSFLTGELAGRFGGISPQPEEMGGKFAIGLIRSWYPGDDDPKVVLATPPVIGSIEHLLSIIRIDFSGLRKLPHASDGVFAAISKIFAWLLPLRSHSLTPALLHKMSSAA